MNLSRNLGEELRSLLLEHGDFTAVEVQLKKWNSKEETDRLKGGVHTEASLLKLGWTELLAKDYVIDYI